MGVQGKSLDKGSPGAKNPGPGSTKSSGVAGQRTRGRAQQDPTRSDPETNANAFERKKQPRRLLTTGTPKGLSGEAKCRFAKAEPDVPRRDDQRRRLETRLASRVGTRDDRVQKGPQLHKKCNYGAPRACPEGHANCTVGRRV